MSENNATNNSAQVNNTCCCFSVCCYSCNLFTACLFTTIMGIMAFFFNSDLFMTCCAVLALDIIQYSGSCCFGRNKCFYYFSMFMSGVTFIINIAISIYTYSELIKDNNNKVFEFRTIFNGLFTFIGIFNTMFSGLLFTQSSIYRDKSAIVPEIRTIEMQRSAIPIGTTVVTVNSPPIETQKQPETTNVIGTTQPSTVIAVAGNSVVNASTVPCVNNIDESDLYDIKKYVISDIIFCSIFVIYTFAYPGFHDDAISAFAVIFLIFRIAYMTLICMRKWRTLIYQIVYVVNAIVSIGYVVVLIYLITQMVNFIKVAAKNDVDFYKWLLEHKEYFPDNPTDDNIRSIVKANIYAYGITAFFFFSFSCESFFVTLAGYTLAFPPKDNNSQPKQEEDVVVSLEDNNIPQPQPEKEINTPENNNPPIQQTTIAVRELPDAEEIKKDEIIPFAEIIVDENNENEKTNTPDNDIPPPIL